MKGNEVEFDRLRLVKETAQGTRHATRRERSGRALCLSGGGYRAAVFHLGSLLRLHQAGYLADVTLFSSVSGGSIVSAWLACCYLRTRNDPAEAFPDWCARIDFRAVVVEPFREIAARDIRTWPVLGTVAWNWLHPSMRVGMLQRAYARIFGDTTLQDLPDRPAFVFCATDLTFGVNWIFSKRRIGDYLAGYLRSPGGVPLAQAVAASSSFPPVFGPVRFTATAQDLHRGMYRGDDGDELRARIDLSDGGVYDNLATEPSLRGFAQVLVSDAGAPFPFQSRRWLVKQLLRYTEVVGNQAGALRKRLYFTLRSSGVDGAFWGLTGGRRRDHREPDPGYSQALISDVIGRVRTDLDRFLHDEFSVLVNHGYFACANALERCGWQSSTAAAWPYPVLADESRVRSALRLSHRRFLHDRWWRD